MAEGLLASDAMAAAGAIPNHPSEVPEPFKSTALPLPDRNRDAAVRHRAADVSDAVFGS
jgi:hypothetical protein